jgi:uracil-DNA glycosylase
MVFERNPSNLSALEFERPRSNRPPPHLERGDPGKLFVVGQDPGNAELHGNKAFAGQSGKTLDSWLRAAGLSNDDPRKGVYLTGRRERKNPYA